METIIRDAQLKLLKVFADAAKTFALAGGTALELFYLKHRFSRDLDFFSPQYNLDEIGALILRFNKILDKPLRLESEFTAPSHAQVKFYAAKIKGTSHPLKIDFVEEVFLDQPKIKKFDRIPVYDASDIYFHKIITLTGTNLRQDEIGRETTTGRREVRDIVDIYYLSKKVAPLHKFMKTLARQYQRGLIQWWRSYSRQEAKLGVLDLDIYDSNFDVSEMIAYLDEEIKKFMAEALI